MARKPVANRDMSTTRLLPVAFVALAVATPARAGLVEIAKCQKAIAREGSKFALRVLRSNLKCSEAIVECQLQCELGEFGPSCDPVPLPGCCDPDDPSGNSAYAECLAEADEVCAAEALKRANYELTKQDRITASCLALAPEELCGAQAEGLNFAILNAGCLVLDPLYTCNLTNLVNCVGGPLVHQLLGEITFLLDPQLSDAVAALNLQSQFPGLPVTRKVKGTVAEDRVDVWRISGSEGDKIVVRVATRDDNGDDTSNLHPLLALLESDASTPVDETNVRMVPCAVPNVCGSSCPQFKRTLPVSGVFHLAVQAAGGDSCTGGKYRLAVTSPGGSTPALIADDVVPTP